jgi:hypothetical protein
MRILLEAEARRQSDDQGMALASPEVQRQRHEKAALKRDQRITKLEAELARLREEQAQDGPSHEGPDFKAEEPADARPTAIKRID